MIFLESSFCDRESHCLSYGYERPEDENECKIASKALGIDFHGDATSSFFPKGCFMHSDYDGEHINWNNHSIGGYLKGFKHVCKNCYCNN